jgi:energy-coupling factor transporter transmembrane protein EcfT
MRTGIFAALDPRAKLVAFLAVQVLLFIPSPGVPPTRWAVIAIPLLALLPLAGRSWRLWLRTLALAAPFLAFLAFSAALPPAAGRLELQRVILPILAKSILVFLALALFVMNEEPWRMLQALRQVRIPQSAVVVLAIGYRFAAQWGAELEGARRTWTGRNFNKLSKWSRVRYLGRALPLFFDRLLEGGVHVHDAMASRGFHGRLPAWRRLVFSRRDAVFLALVALTTAAIRLW